MPQQLEMELVPVTWAALQALDGSTVLTPNEKRLLFKMYGFASSGRGCYASLTALADRLGLSIRTVDDLRRALRQLGILRNDRTGGESRWYLVITPDCIPPDPKKLPADEFQRYRERVDNWLQFQRRRVTNPVRERGCYPVRERGATPFPGVNQPRAGTGCIEGEGKGEGKGGTKRTKNPSSSPLPEDESFPQKAEQPAEPELTFRGGRWRREGSGT